MSLADVARIVAAIALLCWLPGYAWGRALLPKMARLERAVVSVGLSIAMMTLALYVASLSTIPLDAATAIWLALALAAAAVVLPLSRWILAQISRGPLGPAASPTRPPPSPGGDATEENPPREDRGK